MSEWSAIDALFAVERLGRAIRAAVSTRDAWEQQSREERAAREAHLIALGRVCTVCGDALGAAEPATLVYCQSRCAREGRLRNRREARARRRAALG